MLQESIAAVVTLVSNADLFLLSPFLALQTVGSIVLLTVADEAAEVRFSVYPYDTPRLGAPASHTWGTRHQTSSAASTI